MDGMIDIAGMVARTPGGAFGIFIIAPLVVGVIFAAATQSAAITLAGMAGTMAVCVLGLGLSPWLFVMVVMTALSSVGVMLQMGWRGK